MANNLAYYIRLSLADGDLGTFKDESNSVKNQRDLILKYIDTHPEFSGWNIHEFVDDGYTGTNDERPDFQRLMELTRQGQIQCIIVKDLSRFARNYIITGDYLEQVFPFLGVRFIAINDGYDSASSTTVEDNMSMVLKSVLNAYYSKDIARKITSAFHQRMRQGTYKGPAPFGYLRSKEEIAFEINPPAAEIVQRIFELTLSGKNRKEAANILNAEGLPTPAVFNQRYNNNLHNTPHTSTEHSLWEPSMLLPILRNAAYCGDRVLRKNVAVIPGSKKRRKARPEEQIIIKDAHPPIVSREDFDRVQQLLPNYRPHKQRHQTREYILNGVVRCGVCKRAMPREKNGTVFLCRHAVMEHSQCPKKEFSSSEIEQILFSTLQPMLQLAASTWKQTQRKNAPGSASDYLAQYQKEIAQAEYEEKRTKQLKLDAYEEYTAGTLSLEEYHKRKAQLNRHGNACHEKIENLKTQEAALNSGIIPHEMQMITESAKEFQYANALSREMVTTFVDAIFLYDTHYEIRWKYQDVWEQLQKHQNEKSKEKKE